MYDVAFCSCVSAKREGSVSIVPVFPARQDVSAPCRRPRPLGGSILPLSLATVPKEEGRYGYQSEQNDVKDCCPIFPVFANEELSLILLFVFDNQNGATPHRCSRARNLDMEAVGSDDCQFFNLFVREMFLCDVEQCVGIEIFDVGIFFCKCIAKIRPACYPLRA